MDIEKLSPIIFLGLFFSYQFIFSIILTPLTKRLLDGPLRQLSINYFEELTKKHFESASRSNNADSAWEEVAMSKIREIGHSRTSYQKRRQNLQYIKNLNPNKRIAAGLAEVLPNQHNIVFQQELACFLCNILNKSETTNNVVDKGSIAKQLNTPLHAFNNLMAAWLASISLYLLFWARLDTYSATAILFHCVIAFIFMCLPAFQAKIKLRTIATYVLFCLFAILIALAYYAFVSHSGVNQQIINLDKFGYEGIVVTINYPRWVTIDEIQSCEEYNLIYTLVEGGELPGHIRFRFETSSFSARNSKCQAIIPLVNKENTEGVAYEFHFTPLDRSSLRQPVTTIMPILLLSGNSIPLDDHRLSIKIEQLHWGLIRQAVLLIASGGGLTLFVLVSQLVAFLKK